LDKNVKHKEMKAIVQILNARKEENKGTGFRVRKNFVKPSKIKRFVRDYPILQYSDARSRK